MANGENPSGDERGGFLSEGQIFLCNLLTIFLVTTVVTACVLYGLKSFFEEE